MLEPRSNWERLRERLERFGQEHVLRWWPELTVEQQERLARQLESVELEELQELYESFCRLGRLPGISQDELERVRPWGEIVRLPQTEQEQARWEEARRLGEQALRDGRVATLVVAGGQGTRLGFAHPKGLFPIGPVSNASLFQLLAEQVVARSRRHHTTIPYLIMTSRATHDETVRFFQEHQYFGLPAETVRFFRQGELPCLDASSGRLLLEAKDRLATGPDGHGGVIQALRRAGLLEWLAERGVDLIFYHHVDNPCVNVCDPAFLGFHLLHKAEMSLKVISKAWPEEKLGTVVELDGRVRVVEYIDLPSEIALRRDADGNLVFWAGSPGIHVFSRSFLERLAVDGLHLPLHVARKVVPYLNDEGKLVRPEAPNGLKFERFVFDALAFAQQVVAVEADREEEFHPVKNARVDEYTPDTPEKTQKALLEKWRRWLQQVGAELEPDAQVEISPLVALEPEDLRTVVQAGQRFAGKVYLNASAGTVENAEGG